MNVKLIFFTEYLLQSKTIGASHVFFVWIKHYLSNLQIPLQLPESYFSKRGLELVTLIHKTAVAIGNPCSSPSYYSNLPKSTETLT